MLKRFVLVSIVLLLMGVLSGPMSLSASANPPEPYPFSGRYPAEIILTTPQQMSTLTQSGVEVGNLRTVDPDHTFPRSGDPFESLVATVYVTPAEAERLEQQNFQVRPIPNEGLRAFGQYGPGTTGRDAWPTFEQFVARMQGIADSYPDIVRLVSIGQSVQGREIWMLKISDNPDAEEDEPEFKYTSTMHGDEPVGTEMILRLAELLTSSYGADPDLTALVDEMEIWLCPLHNPDGYVAGTRSNAHGEDLNRNFPDPVTDPVDDPAGREPETQAFMNFGYQHSFVMGTNYHTGAQVVNFPWDSMTSYAPDDDIYYEYSVGYAVRNSFIWNGGFPNGVTRGWEWYIIHGGMQDWAYYWHGEHHVTIELSNTKWPPYTQMDAHWDQNEEAMLWWMGRALTGVRGLVTDATTGDPLEATVEVVQVAMPVYSDPEVGDYHRLLLPGTFTVTASAYGYQDQAAPVTVITGAASIQNFALVPADTWTVQGTVTEAGTELPLAATVEFIGTGVSAQTDPADGSYTAELYQGAYTMHVSAPGHRPQEREIILTGNQVQDFSLELSPCTLLVDDDQGENYQTYYQNALEAAGVDYDTWTVGTQGSPSASDLSGYGRVIWLTGDDYGSTLSTADQSALAAFLDGGGKLFLSGQDIGYDIGSSTFYANYLHAQYVNDNSNDTTLTGLDFMVGLDVSIAGGDGANNQLYPSQINPANDGVVVYQYSPGVYGGVAYQDDTYGVTYLAFGFEAINSAADRTAVMSTTLAWLGGCEDLPQAGVALVADSSGQTGAAGETVTYTLTLTNTGSSTDTFTLSLTGNAWPTEVDVEQTPLLAPGATAVAQVQVNIPAGVEDGDEDSVTVTAISGLDPATQDALTLTTTAEAACTTVYGADFGWAAPVRTGRTATFSGTVSGGTAPHSFTWAFGDGTGGGGEIVTHAYDHAIAIAHEVTVQMTVTNECGLDSAEQMVEVWFFFDFDLDCDVDVADVMLAAARWSCAEGDPCYDPTYDSDLNGEINILDIMQAAGRWGWACEQP